MKKNVLRLSIETLVLVAVWETPFVFQGCFTITNKQKRSKQTLFFRCECRVNEKMNILDPDFCPTDYQFTHLFSKQAAIPLDIAKNEMGDALYLLKYALKATLEKVITNPKQDFTYIDEVAMSRIVREIEVHLVSQTQGDIQADLGFAVSIDFTPTEMSGEKAALALLRIDKIN